MCSLFPDWVDCMFLEKFLLDYLLSFSVLNGFSIFLPDICMLSTSLSEDSCLYV